MKPTHVPQAAPEAPARVEFQVQFSGGPKGRRQARVIQHTASPEHESPATSASSPAPESVKKASPSQVPRITRLLVLGHHFERLVRDGAVKNYAEIARLTGLSRARVTQITNLTLLAPEIQTAILSSSERPADCESPFEKGLRTLTIVPAWAKQQRNWIHRIR